MMNIQALVNPIAKFGAKMAFKLKLNSPKILIALGVAGTIGAVVLACTETPEACDILEDHQKELDQIRRDREAQEEGLLSVLLPIDDKDFRKEIVKVYGKTTWRLIKNYAPAFTLLLLSLAAFLYSNGILTRRNLELMAACKALEESFSTYRDRIKERYGEQADFDAAFINEHTGEKREVVNAEGKTLTGEKIKLSCQASPYARFFDETNINWEKDPTTNMFFLQAQEKFANQKLESQGFLFLNDVYEALGFPKSSVGQLVGWYLGGDGDDHVDFGIFDGDDYKKRDFVNGWEPAVLLDFNVDGVIYDLI